MQAQVINEKDEINVKIMITIPEAVKITGLSDWALRKLCTEEKIKTFRSGAKWYINQKSLLQFLEVDV